MDETFYADASVIDIPATARSGKKPTCGRVRVTDTTEHLSALARCERAGEWPTFIAYFEPAGKFELVQCRPLEDAAIAEDGTACVEIRVTAVTDPAKTIGYDRHRWENQNPNYAKAVLKLVDWIDKKLGFKASDWQGIEDGEVVPVAGPSPAVLAAPVLEPAAEEAPSVPPHPRGRIVVPFDDAEDTPTDDDTTSEED